MQQGNKVYSVSKIDLIDDKLNQSQNQTQQAAEIDSLLMLQQQQKIQITIRVLKPLHLMI